VSYVSTIIGSNPDNYWRLNESSGASVGLDYGNVPCHVYAAYQTTANHITPLWPSFGWSGVASDGGSASMNSGGLRSFAQQTTGAHTVLLHDPGSIECWAFMEDARSDLDVGYWLPGAPTNEHLWGLQIVSSSVTMTALVAGASASAVVSETHRWHHLVMTWDATGFFLLIDGSQVATSGRNVTNFTGAGVDLAIGHMDPANQPFEPAGFVTEVAIYRRRLPTSEIAVHFNNADTAQTPITRLVPLVRTSGGSGGQSFAYSLGVTHTAFSGSGSISVPTGLRGFMIDIQDPKPVGRVSPGQPPYLWDVGWVSLLDANGILEERRPNRDRTVWLPERAAIANEFTWDLNPGWSIVVTELDPA